MTAPTKQIVDTSVEPPPASDIGGSDEVVDFGDQKAKFKFKQLKDRTPGESWILMVYGPSKSGKTYFAGTAGARTLFINIGDGLETLMAPAFTTKYPDAKNMIVVDIRETAANSAQAFDQVAEAIDHALKHFPEKFDTIVLDEATALRKFALNRAMELNTAQRTQSNRGNRLDDYVKADVGDFGVEMDMIEWFLGTYVPIFKSMNKHFLMLAHERQIYRKPAKIGDDPVLARVLPGFTGKTFPDKVPAYFDDVWHSEAVGGDENIVYRMRTAGSELELGGARHGGIFNVVEKNPNYLEMLKRIQLAQPKPPKNAR